VVIINQQILLPQKGKKSHRYNICFHRNVQGHWYFSKVSKEKLKHRLMVSEVSEFMCF